MDLGPRTQEVLHAQIGRGAALWNEEFHGNADYWDAVEDEYGPRHFGFDGEPVSMRVWAILHSAPERLLAQEWVRPCDSKLSYWLSTVWLGLDHGFMRDEVLIFETMLFAPGPVRWFDVHYSVGYGHDIDQWRFSTWVGALNFHNDLVTSMRSAPGIIPSYGD